MLGGDGASGRSMDPLLVLLAYVLCGAAMYERPRTCSGRGLSPTNCHD